MFDKACAIAEMSILQHSNSTTKVNEGERELYMDSEETARRLQIDLCNAFMTHVLCMSLVEHELASVLLTRLVRSKVLIVGQFVWVE